MTEYVYIGSNRPLALGDVNDRGIQKGSVIYYEDFDHLPKFYFEANIDDNTGERFSFSKHLSPFRYQVASMNSLPDEGEPFLSEEGTSFFNYIQEHFNDNNVKKIAVLFSLNSYEDGPISKHLEIPLEKLTIGDFYYKESKLLEITR